MNRKFKNNPVDAVVGGRTFHFESEMEYYWAQYLEFLRENWDYENKDCVFKFGDSTYTVDFITYHEPNVFYEVKGYLSQVDIRRFRLLQKYHPGTQICLVVSRIPKSHKNPAGVWKRGKRRTNLYASAEKYTQRIIEAAPIFKQLGGILVEPPMIRADEDYCGPQKPYHRSLINQ